MKSVLAEAKPIELALVTMPGKLLFADCRHHPAGLPRSVRLNANDPVPRKLKIAVDLPTGQSPVELRSVEPELGTDRGVVSADRCGITKKFRLVL
jgi:hypothetical protein